MLSLLFVRTIKCDVCQIYNSPLCVFACVCTYLCLFHSEQMWASAIAVKAINTCLEVFVSGCVWFAATAVVICFALCLYMCLCELSDILDLFMHSYLWKTDSQTCECLLNWEMIRSCTSCFGLLDVVAFNQFDYVRSYITLLIWQQLSLTLKCL